ncbi:VOC family protein [Paucibacter sp. APW11]|uniref:VOC family protein n=1 Tax=Roseateles aquae TaxID=3077235 RepID=A0ABU3PDP7_9BURK|nr:VOC family protein [Paucibacter sp. APW11]MDT9000001.1 VOC family protein [Paucibacter sp. APW11]
MSATAVFGAVIFAKDPLRLAAFYQGLLGLETAHSEPGLLVLDGQGVQLVVHGLPPAIAAEIEIGTPPQRREDSALKLFFQVPSLDLARARAASLGGALNPPEQVWSARDFRACDGHDPEGNVIQLREPA